MASTATRSTAVLPFAILLICGSVWGATIPMMKVAVSTGYQPMGLIFWQVFIVSVALGPVVMLRRERVPMRPHHLRYYALIGAIGTLIPSNVSFTVAAHLPAGILGVLLATVPMFSLLIALAIRSERFQARRMAGIGLGVAAMMLLAVPEARLPGGGMAALLLLGLFAPFCYGMEGNIVERLAPADVSPLVVIFASSVIATPVAGLIAWFSGVWVDLTRPWGAPEWALLGSSLGHGGGLYRICRAGRIGGRGVQQPNFLCRDARRDRVQSGLFARELSGKRMDRDCDDDGRIADGAARGADAGGGVNVHRDERCRGQALSCFR